MDKVWPREYPEKKESKMKKKPKAPLPDTRLGKEFVYMVLMPIALQASAQSHRNRYRENFSAIYERLRDLKNSLDKLIIGRVNKNTGVYRIRLYYKILAEKLILNIVSGNRSEIKSNIEQIMRSEGINFIERAPSPISTEEKFIIKADFNGLPHFPKAQDLSPFYQEVSKQEKTSSSQFSPDDYNINDIPSWKALKQFPSFRKTEYKIRAALAEKNISPDQINRLNAFDTIHLLRSYYNEKELYAPESSKSRFIKFFIKHHEKDFRNYLKNNKPIIIEALKNRNIMINEHSHKDEYQLFVDNCIKLMKEKGTVPPLFNIHHKIPVKDTDRLDLVNSPQNLCLILEVPYHTMLHLFDSNNNGSTIFDRRLKRVELPQDIIFFGGFDGASCIYHNYAQDKTKNISPILKTKQGRD